MGTLGFVQQVFMTKQSRKSSLKELVKYCLFCCSLVTSFTLHLLGWVDRQQTSWLEHSCFKVPISGFLVFTRLERNNMVSYGIPSMDDMLAVSVGQLWATEAHGGFVASAQQLAAQSLIEQGEVWWEQLFSWLHSPISLSHQWPPKRKWIPSPMKSRNHYWQMIFLDLHPLGPLIL